MVAAWGPTLSVMFEEAGFEMDVYDIFFFTRPHAVSLSRQYDFITATEVVEHLAAPGEVLGERIAQLDHGGYLGLMTKRVTSQEAFARWHYINDPTHVSFLAKPPFAGGRRKRG